MFSKGSSYDATIEKNLRSVCNGLKRANGFFKLVMVVMLQSANPCLEFLLHRHDDALDKGPYNDTRRGACRVGNNSQGKRGDDGKPVRLITMEGSIMSSSPKVL